MALLSNAPYICLTETHLNPSVLEISIQGYTLYRSDREGRSHGGVCIFLRNDILAEVLVKDSNSFCDTLVLEIRQLNLILVNVYRPPNCPETLFKQTLELISVHIRNLENYNKHSRDIIIHGDFNFPFLSFDGSNINITGKCDKSDRNQAECLIQMADEFFLDQYIRKPTRGRNILDLVLCNNHYLIRDYRIIVNSSLSDHYTICINLNHKDVQYDKKSQTKTNISATELPNYDYFQCDEEHQEP